MALLRFKEVLAAILFAVLILNPSRILAVETLALPNVESKPDISVEVEIQTTSDLLRTRVHPTQQVFENWQKYLASLKDLKARNIEAIHPQAKLKFFQFLDAHSCQSKANSLPVDLRSLLDLFNTIETQKSSWESETKKEFLLHSQGSMVPVTIHVDSNNEIYLQFGSSILGRGATKEFIKVTDYDRFEPIARGTVLQNDSRSINERMVLTHVATHLDTKEFSPDLPKYVGSRIIVSPLYERSLDKPSPLKSTQLEAKAKLSSMDSMDSMDSLFQSRSLILSPKRNHSSNNPEFSTDEQKLEFLRQVALTLHSLHRINVNHRDIKPGNILVKQVPGQDPPNHLKFALTDFDISMILSKESIEESEEKLKKTEKPEIAGSFPYIPPELYEQRWLGKSWEVKRDNAFKGDVYSLAVTAYHLFYDKTPAFLGKGGLADISDAPEKYKLFKANMDLSRDDNPILALLVEAMNPDPTQRMNSAELIKRINHLIHERKKQNSPLIKTNPPAFSG